MENKKAELKSIDEYIAQYPELQEKFQTLRRKAIIDAAPGARKERVGRCKPLR
jgi:prephenate dehydrogenase